VTPLRLAHRGDWRVAPENSLDAMRAALRIPGCDGLEFDIRFTRDGIPVLLHDATLDRVQGRPGAVAELALADVLPRGVPPLADVLATVGREAFLDIELKVLPTEAFLDAVGEARGESDAERIHRAAISSFDAAALDWVGQRRPGWARWLNAVALDDVTLARARALGCEGVAVLASAIEPRSLARAVAADLEVVAWTVRRRSTYDRLARLGVRAICVEGAALDAP
jgi:glycerophosphoryl diester phosphodiesterase